MKEDRFLRLKLFGNLGYLTTYYVKKLLDRAKSRDERRALKSVSHKLKSLGIDVGLAMDNEPKVVVNLSSRNLSAAETNLLNQGLNYSFFPEKLNVSQVRTEFEYIYKQIRYYLNNSNRIVFKQKLMGLYERYVTTFLSMQLKKELSALVEKHTWNRVILRIIDNTWNIGHNFRLKDQQKTLMKYGVVYKLTCSCGSSYIGQTRRNLINRLKEHSSSDKSEVYRHLMDNPDHKLDFTKPNILSSSGDSARLLILESLFIQKNEPLLNVDSKSAPLYLFNC